MGLTPVPSEMDPVLSLLSQIAGSVFGGLVGGFTGFFASRLLEIQASRRMRGNVAAALAGEIDAVCRQLSETYLPLLNADVDALRAGREVLHRYRGEREYMPIFRSLGVHVGLLPEPLPADLAFWYSELTIVLEHQRALHDLLAGADLPRAISMAEIQRADAEALLRTGPPLVERLREL